MADWRNHLTEEQVRSGRCPQHTWEGCNLLMRIHRNIFLISMTHPIIQVLFQGNQFFLNLINQYEFKVSCMASWEEQGLAGSGFNFVYDL